MTPSNLFWSLLLLFSTIGAGVVTVIEVPLPVKVAVMFWFLIVCPGMALVRLLQLESRLAEWSLAIGLSLTLDAFVANTMAYSQTWFPAIGLIVLIMIALTGVAVQLSRWESY